MLKEKGTKRPDLQNVWPGRARQLSVGAVVEPTLIRGLFLSAGLAVMASAAVYGLSYFLFTIHEEIGISADAALPIAVWTFPIVLVGSLIGCLVRKAHPGAP